MSERFACAPAERAHFTNWLSAMRLFLLEHNPVARTLKHMVDVNATGPSAGARMEICVRDGPQQGSTEIAACYRSTASPLLPPHRELVVYPFAEDPRDPGTTREGVRYEGRRIISERDSLYEVLQYPLLFPRGVGGYYEKRFEGRGSERRLIAQVVSTTGTPLTLHAYVRAALYQSEALRLCGRLADEWTLDNFSRWQAANFNYLKWQLHRGAQGSRVSVSRSHATQTIQSARTRVSGAEEFQHVGRLLSLPASVPGSRGYQNRLLDDGMSVVDRLGKPTLFITFTCNSNWPEIVSQLMPGQSAAELSAITNRVFKMRLNNLMAKLRSGHYFGRRAVYITAVTEHQKRGLAHAHIAFRFEGDQPTSSEAIDALVSAELPQLTEDSSDDDRAVHRMVSSYMIHSCREGRCFKAGTPVASRTCKYGYPYTDNEVTYADDRGYIQYRRRGPDSRNANVVSYNRAMLLEFDTHINVQIAHTVNILSYLFKYFVKGVDMIRMAVPTVMVNGQQRHDEFEEFERARYLSASEASWRFLGFDVNSLEPAVTVYGVHAEGEDALTVGDGESLEEAGARVSWLLRYFQRPLEAQFDDLKYLQYYETYNVKRVMTGNPPLEKRFRDAVPGDPYHVWPRVALHVCRMYKARPSEGRRYYIRKLLQWVPARSYEDLCTVDDVLVRSAEGQLDFQRACYLRGLISQDGEYADAMHEAVRLQQLPFHVRCLYADCVQDGANSITLRDQFLGYMVHDFDNRRNECLEPGYVPSPMALWLFYEHISSILASNGRSMNQYGLPEMHQVPMPPEMMMAADEEGEGAHRGTTGSQPLMFEPDYDANARFYDTHVASLTHEQSAILAAVQRAVQNPEIEDRCFFVDGPGGTGKSFLMKVLAAWANSDPGTACLCAAFQGIVAQMYQHGVTLHRAFALPLDTEFASGNVATSSVQAGSAHGNRLASFKLFIIDEISMVHSTYLTIIDQCLRNVTRCDVRFGGAVVLCGGDMRQLSAVVPGGSHLDTVAASVISNSLWAGFTPFRLTIPQRDRRDPEWSAAVLAIGSGQAPRFNSAKEPMTVEGSALSKAHYVAVPPSVTVFHDAKHAIEWLYDGVQPEGTVARDNWHSPASKRAMLCPLNAMVDTFNETILRSDLLHFNGASTGDCEGSIIRLLASEQREQDDEGPHTNWNRTHDVSEDFMAKLTNSGVPNHVLELRVGCIVMVMRNLCAKYGIMNGVKLRVEAISRFLVVARTLCSDQRKVLLPRIQFSMTVPTSAVRIIRRQFPLRLAYAQTINKSQGQTLARVCFDVRSPVFTHGASYVAMGRVEEAADLALLVGDDAIGPDGRCYILNIVYSELVNGVFAGSDVGARRPFSVGTIPRIRVLASTPQPGSIPSQLERAPQLGRGLDAMVTFLKEQLAHAHITAMALNDGCRSLQCCVPMQRRGRATQTTVYRPEPAGDSRQRANVGREAPSGSGFGRSATSTARTTQSGRHFSWVYMPAILAALDLEVDERDTRTVWLHLGGDVQASDLWTNFVDALRADFAARGVTEDSIVWQRPGVYMTQEEQERVLFPSVFTDSGDAARTRTGRLYQQIALWLSSPLSPL